MLLFEKQLFGLPGIVITVEECDATGVE